MDNLENIFGLFSMMRMIYLLIVKTTYIDLKSSPVYYVGMYKKLILNHINFNKKVLNFFKKANEEFNIEDIKRGWGVCCL